MLNKVACFVFCSRTSLSCLVSGISAAGPLLDNLDASIQLSGALQFTIPPWSMPPPQETSGIPPIPKEKSEKVRETFMKNFAPPAETYGHNSMGVSDEEWKARVDLAAVYRLCVHYGFHEGIVNHMSVSCFACNFPALQGVYPDSSTSSPAHVTSALHGSEPHRADLLTSNSRMIIMSLWGC